MEKEKLFLNWNSSGFGIEMKPYEFNYVSEEIPNSFFNPNWENSMDKSDPFESALSSIVSSPVTVTSISNEPVRIRELNGRLGNVCNSREISPSNSYMNNTNSTNPSSYSTPLNSPPKLNVPILGADPAFLERAARFSCFNSLTGKFGLGESKIPRKPKEIGDSREESSVSEQIPDVELTKRVDSNSRKRKAIARGKAKETAPSGYNAIAKIVAEKDESNAKRSKSSSSSSPEEEKKEDQKQNKENSKPPEPPKDYIHVRARRGQATDSHSLAERVRREKISERMKFLQDLVPSCNKVTGKAVVLDEIINYVQSLQRQVEFLSMKLATVNPRMDINMKALVSNTKNKFEGRGTLLEQNVYQLETLPYNYNSQQGFSSNSQTHLNPYLPSFDGFSHSSPPLQVSALWEDDLQSVVQMGFGQNQQQGFHGEGSISGGQMRVEL